MSHDEREHWNERYTEDNHDPPEEPVDVLRDRIDALPNGRALDVATGGGRNALYLAERDYTVEAIDISEEGLAIARKRANDHGVADALEFVRTDVEEYNLPRGGYDVIVVTYYHSLDVIPSLKRSLAPGGVLLYEHRLHPPDDDSHRFRFHPNDLLRACLDLRIVDYEEPLEIGDDATVRLVARRE